MNEQQQKTEEVDWAKVTEFQEALNEYSEEKLKRALVFNPKDLVRKSKEIHEVYDEDLGTIRYVHLTYADLNKISEMQSLNDRERSVHFLAKQLAPANPGVTVEDLNALPYEVVVRLLVKLQGEGSFFFKKLPQPARPSKNGSTPTFSPKT